MIDLSHWDFAIDFSGAEAAALILGIPPDESPETANKIRPVVERMRRCYALARNQHALQLNPEHAAKIRVHSTMLESVEMLYLEGQVVIGDFEDSFRFDEWISGDESNFELQRFSRVVLENWLKSIKMRSAYQFEKHQSEQTDEKPEKPPSTRERTTYLNIIGALLELIKTPRNGRDSDAAVIRELEENYSDKQGISKRKMQTVFAEAKRSLTN